MGGNKLLEIVATQKMQNIGPFFHTVLLSVPQ
jgi:hypothetical protein